MAAVDPKRLHQPIDLDHSSHANATLAVLHEAFRPRSAIPLPAPDVDRPLALISVAAMLAVSIVQLDPELSLPMYAHPGDAGLDLCAREDGVIAASGGRVIMPTGIAMAIPVGYAGFVLPRSGLALRHGISIVNAPGLIDSAYRGEIKVVLLNTDPATDYQVHRGDRIAQLVVQPVEEVTWHVVGSLPGDDRGGGFGRDIIHALGGPRHGDSIMMIGGVRYAHICTL